MASDPHPKPHGSVAVPLVTGVDDYDVLRHLNAWLPATYEEHLRWVEAAGAELAEAGATVDIVPLWTPLFLLWCTEMGVAPGEPDALGRWADREAVPFVSYCAYEYGPLDPIADLEAVRSKAIAEVVSRPELHDQRSLLHRWAASTALLNEIGNRVGPRAEIDVHVPAWRTKAHWHLDGSSCPEAVTCEDHAHSATLAAMGGGGWLVLTQYDELNGRVVRVWELGGEAGVTGLSAADAAAVCDPLPGTVLANAWGLPAQAA